MFSRSLSVVCSRFKIIRPQAIQMRMDSTQDTEGGKGSNCPHDPPCKSIYAQEPHVPKTCCTMVDAVRRDPDFMACLQKNIANPTAGCTTKSFETSPCETPTLPKNRSVQYTFLGESAWENPPCCVIPCNTGLYERHDVKYLKPHVDRCYQRTWYECPARCKVKVPICNAPQCDFEPPEHRPRGSINKAPTKVQPPINLSGPCPKIRLPGCKTVRGRTTCVPPVAPSCCKKRCTPYPSFSECCWRRPDPKAPSECGCCDIQSACQMFARARWLAENVKW